MSSLFRLIAAAQFVVSTALDVVVSACWLTALSAPEVESLANVTTVSPPKTPQIFCGLTYADLHVGTEQNSHRGSPRVYDPVMAV
jgi:hypothetical protein